MDLPKNIVNSSHRGSANYSYEWWYFHFISKDISFNIVVHETDIFGLETDPYMSISLIGPGGRVLHKKRGLGKGQIAKNGLYLQVSGIVRESINEVEFSFNFDEEIKFSGKIAKKFPSMEVNNGVLYDNGRQKSNWVVQIPQGQFEGNLFLDGQMKAISGTAYQDHQWGEISIQGFVSDWVWGHFANDKLAVVFFKILCQDGSRVDRYGFVNKEGMLTGTSVGGTYLAQLIDSAEPENVNLTCNTSFGRKRNLVFHLDPRGLLRKRAREKHGDFEATYLRWAEKAKLMGNYEIGNKAENLSGLTEYLGIRRK